MIVQRLREIQSTYGFLPDKALERLAKDTSVPLYRIQEVASFFDSFRQEWDKPARVEIKVCRDYTCHHHGAPAVMSALKGLAKPGDVVVEGVSCVGRCDRAPAICISRHGDGEHGPGETHAHGHVADDGSFHDFIYAGRKPEEYRRIAMPIVNGDAPQVSDLDGTYKFHTNFPEWQIDPYRTKRGDSVPTYRAVREFVAEFPKPILPPQKPDPNLKDAAKENAEREYSLKLVRSHPWLNRLDPSGLLGMGGAGVPAYRKWFDVWTAAGDEKYIVCNGDESEPGTFKDREIFLRTPHLVIEGVILAGLFTNATAGYIYVRHEYPEQIEALRAEVKRAQSELNACGERIFGTERNFPVEVFVSPGGYICGEQSALLEAMEDRRAQPRNRPPELATNGLRDKPTVVNNVETLSWTPATLLNHDTAQELAQLDACVKEAEERARKDIERAGEDKGKRKGGEKALADAPLSGAKAATAKASWYAKIGRGCKGRRILSISGDLEKPGVYELPIGLTMGELIQMAGGMKGGRTLKAIAPSGPSGGLLPAWLPVAPGWQDRMKAKLGESADKAVMEKQFAAMMDGVTDYYDLTRTPLDLGLFKQLGYIFGVNVSIMLGAGLAVYAEGTNILDQALNYTEFFRNESCGKCVPCRIGSEKLVQIGTTVKKKLDAKQLSAAEADEYRSDAIELAGTLILTSICGLGQVAPNPLATAFELFPDEIPRLQ